MDWIDRMWAPNEAQKGAIFSKLVIEFFYYYFFLKSKLVKNLNKNIYIKKEIFLGCVKCSGLFVKIFSYYSFQRKTYLCDRLVQVKLVLVTSTPRVTDKPSTNPQS